MAYIMVKVLLVLVVVQLCLENVQPNTTAQCGVPQISKNKLILHGYETTPGEWPWHAAVYRSKLFSDEYICGGTLVSELFVLTAAHCMIAENGYQISHKNIFIRLGVHNLRALNRGSLQQHSIRKIYSHPSHNSEQVWNDIAILELATEAEFGSYVQPACLGLTHNLTGLFGTVIGWGMTENNELSPTLRSSRMPVIDFYTCLKSDRALFGETMSEGILCAGYTNGTTICNGDSGGGLFFQYKNSWYLVGIVSYSGLRSSQNRLCDKNGYGGFTNVQMYLPWITSKTELQFDDVNVSEVRNDIPRDEILRGVYENPLPSECGFSCGEQDLNNPLLSYVHFPWTAILQFNGSRHVQYDTFLGNFCQGSLISNRYVLTTAECIEQNELRAKVTIGAKECDNLDGNSTVQEYEVENVLPHKNFIKSTKENDIALLRLVEKVVFTDTIRPICLPVDQFLRQLDFADFTVTTWKILNNTIIEKIPIQPITKVCKSPNMFEKHVQLRNDSSCAVAWTDNPSPILRKGAPLTKWMEYNDTGRYILYGFISAKYSPTAERTFLYTNVTEYMDWIMENLKP